MESSLHYKYWTILIYIALWILISFIIAFVWYSFFSNAFLDRLYITAFVSGNLVIMIPFLKNIIQTGKLLELSVPLNILVLTALGLLAITVWLGCDTLLLYLILPKLWLFFYPAIPLFALSGVFVYIVIILRVMLLSWSESECFDESGEEEKVHKEEILSQHQEIDSIIDRISVKMHSNIHLIPVETIYYLQSEGDYVLIFSEQGKFIKEQTMKYFEQHLSSNMFVRIHRSFIVNVEMISRMECYGKNKQLVILRNGSQLKMSQIGYRSLKAKLQL